MANKRKHSGNPNIVALGAATRFKPGQNPNPGGRPKGLSITRIVRELLQQPIANGSDVTHADLVGQKVLSLIEAGDKDMIRLVWAYTDGQPVARNENGEAGTFTGMEDVPTPDLIKLVKKAQ